MPIAMHRRMSPTRSPRAGDVRFAAELDQLLSPVLSPASPRTPPSSSAGAAGRPFVKNPSPLAKCKDSGGIDTALELLEKDIFYKYGQAAKRRSRCASPWRVLWPLLLLVAIGCGLFLWRAGQGDQEDAESFVTVKGLQFYKDCRPFYFAGFNTHDAVTAALLNPTDYNVEGGKSGKAQVRDMFSQSRSAQLSVVRTWVHTNDQQFPFQIEPGVYDEAAFRALDFVIEEARRNGLKLVLSLVDNWKYYNGVDQFVDWSKTAPPRTHDRPVEKGGDPTPMHELDEETKNYEVARHALFYNDTDCRHLYKKHIYTIINRRNTFSGHLYKDDPAIMAWDLLNEPRCETWRVPECNQLFQGWIEEMSTYLKSIDPNHLVTIGSEGFFGQGSWEVYNNPQPWSGDMGQDFVENHLPESIDFASIHVWPDTWKRSGENFEREWTQSHLDVASRLLGKPLVVEEFGKKLPPYQHNDANIKELRDPIFKTTFSMVEKSITEGSAIGGSMFWRWTLPMFAGHGRGEYEVAMHDSTFQLIVEHAAFVSKWTNSIPPQHQCEANCWVPRTSLLTKSCENLPQVCETYWKIVEDYGFDNSTSAIHALQEATAAVGHRHIGLNGLQVYTTKSACCLPGLGGHSQGCSWHTWLV